MSQATFTRNRKKVTRERSTRADDKSNPFSPSKNYDAHVLTRKRMPAASQVEQDRRMLLALRARLQGNMLQTADDVLSNEGIEKTCASPDTADLACEVVEQDVALNLIGSVADTLGQIDIALQRIENGGYGRCADCNTKIPAARLEAIPYATCCVQCAARHEAAT